MPKQQATELEFLKWWYQNVDFGPSSEDIYSSLKECFKEATGKELPDGYK